MTEQRNQDEAVVSESALDSLARIIHVESYCDDEKDAGRVATVIINRVNSEEFPNSVAEVVADPKQFPSVAHPMFDEEPCPGAVAAARRIFVEGERDLGEDVVFFYNPTHTSDTGAWLLRLQENTVVKGKDHHFAR